MGLIVYLLDRHTVVCIEVFLLFLLFLFSG